MNEKNQRRTRIKICGITRPEDGVAAARCGADAIGLVFYERSPRAVSIVQARAVVVALPPFVTVVGLFVNAPAEQVERVLEAVPLDVLQFHGDEPAAACERHRRPYVKAIRMREGIDLRTVSQTYRTAAGLLLDSYQAGVPGGTGLAFDWRLIPSDLPIPVVLAGGLDEHNVGRAIAEARPYAVDTSSGVELEKGIKDPARIAGFVHAVGAADRLVK